ncbi:hypothetical protein Taro_037259 [Colocasia esculenta]|uniref:Uncharacterized protein n=1 Tax=Colocasia esculenta TaxID=4460 RepID=A0A843W974_COLES|nr:hypothetical protein [Colocasia esculenta]
MGRYIRALHKTGKPFHKGEKSPKKWLRRQYLEICTSKNSGYYSEAPIRNRHFDPVGKRLHSEISDPAQNSSPGAWSRAVDAIAYGHLFAQMDITFYSRLPRLRESLAEPTLGAGLSRRSEAVFNSSRDLLPRNFAPERAL